MDNRLKSRRNLEDHQPLGASGNFMPQTNQTCKLQEKLKSELPDQSYAALNGELTKDSKVFRCKYFGDHQNQQIIRKAAKEDELVRYMKDLPRYLERQESIQERVLNMGVLNWGRLEKWQSRQQQMPYRISSYTESSDCASSSSSTDGSFTYSSRGLSCSPTLQRTCRPSLQFHLKASSIGAHSEVKSTCEIVERLQDIGTPQRNTLKGQEKFHCTARDSSRVKGRSIDSSKSFRFRGKDDSIYLVLSGGTSTSGLVGQGRVSPGDGLNPRLVGSGLVHELTLSLCVVGGARNFSWEAGV